MKRALRVVNSVLVIATALILTLPASYLLADELFQVVAAVDSAADVQSFQDKPISMVTDALGAPSAAWFNPTDETLIDYSYVGQSTVLTFHVLKDGKNIQEVESDSRSGWENGGCMTYPECPKKAA